MPCNPTKMPGGSTAIICTRGRRQEAPCVKCGKPSTALCDYPLRGAKAGSTCSRPICDKCGVHQPNNTDFCPTHAAMLTTEGRLKL